jgi:hypothetical protein
MRKMTIAVLVASILLPVTLRAQNATDVDALKKRVAQLEQETELMHREIEILKGEIRDLKAQLAATQKEPGGGGAALTRRGTGPFPALLRSRMSANHSNAGAATKALVTMEAIWRSQDIDKNGVADYWTRDIAGFYAVHNEGKPVALIDKAFARADATPAMNYLVLEGGPVAKQGYFFKAIKTDPDGKPYVKPDSLPPKAENAPDGPSTNSSRFAFCAYPDKYGVDGKLTFIVCEDGVVWQKDLGADAKGVDAWPNPDKEGSGWVQFGG